MKSDLLQGNIRSQLITLALPLLLGNILQQFYNTADALIIGSFLGTNAFAAVGVAGSVMNLFIFMLNGFCIGVSILFGQLYGHGDQDAFRREMFVSLTLGCGITLLLSALFILLLRPILYLIQTPAELMGDASAYLVIIIAGMITTYFYNLFSNVLRAVGNTKASLYFLCISVVLNCLLDYLFVAVLPMGIAGAALATVLAQLVSAVCCLLYIRHGFRFMLCTARDAGWHRTLIRRTLSFGVASALHQSSLYIGKLLVQGAVNTLGTAGIAAYTATSRIEGVANSFGSSAGQAMSVFLSQNYSAGQSERIRSGFRTGFLLNVLMGLALSAIMFLTADPCMRIFLDAADDVSFRYGVEYLRLVSLVYVLCFTGNSFVGFFRGVGKVEAPIIGTTLQIAIRAVLSYLLVGRMGLSAVALATGIGWIFSNSYQVLTWHALQKKICPAPSKTT